MSALSLHHIARVLGGNVVGRQVLAPGPNHSAKDRSLSIRLSPAAPGGFIAFSHAGDDWRACRDHVRSRFGLNRACPTVHVPRAVGQLDKVPDRSWQALAAWGEAVNPGGTPVEVYLRARGLKSITVMDLRFHPACPFAGTRTPALVALVRDIGTNEPKAVHRTALTPDGCKVEVAGHDRLSLGPIAGGAVKLTPDEDVTTCLGIGEGIETTLSLQLVPEFEWSPVWSLLSASGVAGFPVLSGIECLWIAVDHDPTGVRAAEECARRWTRAGRLVFVVRPTRVKTDLNDVVREAGHAA